MSPLEEQACMSPVYHNFVFIMGLIFMAMLSMSSEEGICINMSFTIIAAVM